MNFDSPIKKYRLASEIMFVVSMVLLFFNLAILSPVTDKHYLTTTFKILLAVCNLLFLLLLIAVTLNSFKRPQIKIRDLIPPKAVFILLFIYTVAKIFYLDTIPRWDGAWYFCRLLESVENFNFTLVNFVNGFNWYGHPSMGYAFLMSFGQFLDPGNHCLLNFGNFILAVASVLLFYKFVVYLYKENSIRQTEFCLLTALFAFNPLYFGVSISFDLDFPTLAFLLASLCALLYDRMIIFAFFGTLLVFSKETGAFLYALFFGSTLFCYLINIVKNHKKFFNKQNSGFYKIFNSIMSFLCASIPGILFLCYLLYTGGKLWAGGTLTTWNNQGLHSFGFNWTNFSTRIFEIFILNFNWLLTLIILIFFIKLLWTRKKTSNHYKNIKGILLILLLVYIAFIPFNLFFITYNHPRYVLPSVFFLLIFSHYALINMTSKSNIRMMILAALLILSTIQTYKTVDPLSKTAFKTSSFGNHQILNINPADGMVYNAEYTVIEKLLEQTYKEININENTSLILSDLWVAHINGDRNWSVINTDRTTLRRTFKKNNTFQPKTYLIWDINQSNRPPKAYYINMWFGNKKSELEYLQRFYEINNKKKIEHKGYCFYLYELARL